MYDVLASPETVGKTQESLQKKGYETYLVDSGALALEKIKELIPASASVMNGASVTLETIGYQEYLKNNAHGWNDLHAAVAAESDPVKRAKLRKEAVLSDFYLGSVHALTEDGNFIIASNSGSQLPHIVFTSPNLIFVIGIQKIVPTIAEGLRRVEEYVYPLEDKHMKDLYGVGSMINKVVIFRGENPRMGRKIFIILVKEKLGF